MDAFVEVIGADGMSERFPIEGQQVTLGRAGSAGISLPTASELELEHLLIAPREKEGCWISTSQGAATPTLHKGKPFASGMVPWGTELQIGRFKIKVTNKRTPAKKDGGGVSPVILIASVAVMGIAGWWFLGRSEPDLAAPEGVEPPALFADEVECPSTGDPATNARNAEYQAHSRGDRYHFDPRDGVAAVRLYGEAAACYRRAENSDRATIMETERENMRIAVEADYAGRRLRLHHALQVQDWVKASIETEALAKLTAHLEEGDPYVEWLDRARRILIARAERADAERRSSKNRN